MDIITLNNQVKFAKALKSNRIALYPKSMVPSDVIPLDGQFIDITNIPYLNNLPIHHLVKPRYCGLAREFTDGQIYTGSVNHLIELPMNNQFLFCSDLSMVGLISSTAPGEWWINEQNPGFVVTGSSGVGINVASTKTHSFFNTAMSWVSNKLTNSVFCTPNRIEGNNYQGSLLNIGAWTAVPSVSDVLTPLYTAATFGGSTILLESNDKSKVFVVTYATDDNPRIVLIIPNNSTVASRVQNAVPVDNTDSRPVLFSSIGKNNLQFLNVLDCKAGAFRIPKDKEIKLLSGATVSYQADRIFVTTNNGIDTTLYELVDNVGGEEIINPTVYQNPRLVVRSVFMRKVIYPLALDTPVNTLYCSIANQNLNIEEGSALHQNVNTFCAINTDTYKLEKISEIPTSLRYMQISRDRSTMVLGTQRGYYLYNINRKHYQLPKLPAPRGMVYGLTI